MLDRKNAMRSMLDTVSTKLGQTGANISHLRWHRYICISNYTITLVLFRGLTIRKDYGGHVSIARFSSYLVAIGMLVFCCLNRILSSPHRCVWVIQSFSQHRLFSFLRCLNVYQCWICYCFLDILCVFCSVRTGWVLFLLILFFEI